jgi:hypothetical protein
MSRYLPVRSSTVIVKELDFDRKRRERWARELESHGTLYRARDGRLWGLRALRGQETPGFFIDYVEKTEHNPLGELYPQSWQMLEDERGWTDWLDDKEQELMTVQYLESVAEVPTEPHSWAKVQRKVPRKVPRAAERPPARKKKGKK